MPASIATRISGLFAHHQAQGISLFVLSSAFALVCTSSYCLSKLRNALSIPLRIGQGRRSSLLNSSTAVAGPNESEKSVQRRSEWLKRDGEHAFLKDVLGEDAIAWVKSRNDHCLDYIGEPKSNPMYSKVLSILDSDDKIPYLRKINDEYYNFWQDKAHTRGILRRTTLNSYRSKSPQWETVLDLDALGIEEGESWVFKGYTCYEPPFNEKDDPSNPRERISRALLRLSRGGSDAVVVREFDLDSKRFIPSNEGGFYIPEAKTRVSWLSKDCLVVGTDMKDGKSLTDSGYPRVMREWNRDSPLDVESAPVVYEGESADVAVHMYICRHRNHKYILRGRAVTFYTSTNEVFIPHNTVSTNCSGSFFSNGTWYRLAVQDDANVSVYADQLLVQLRSNWVVQGTRYDAGSLLAADIQNFAKNPEKVVWKVLFTPSPTESLTSFAETKDYLILETLEKVKSRYTFWEYAGGNWNMRGREKEAVIRGSSLYAVDGDYSNDYWFSSSSFLQPTTLSLGRADLGPEGIAKVEKLKSLPAQFDSDGLVEEQFEAVSEDGTKVPYFLVRHRDMPFDGSAPTLMYGYGGFEISLTPSYSAVVGAAWLADNSSTNSNYTCYVMANIRGGGEFGPSWHQAALKENRKLAYDDFIAVAEDIIARKVTSAKRLGIRGGSNGGLLMGNMMVRRPDLFGAICCAVPLLDMKCYHTLLAGASWTAEYGNPEKDDEWSYLQRYSAYHNIDAEAVKKHNYPPLLMTTSTRDDRVHPYHARSFVHRLLDCYMPETTLKAAPVYYYENMEGGHGGAADNKQQAFMTVLYLEFLKKTIGAGRFD